MCDTRCDCRPASDLVVTSSAAWVVTTATVSPQIAIRDPRDLSRDLVLVHVAPSVAERIRSAQPLGASIPRLRQPRVVIDSIG